MPRLPLFLAHGQEAFAIVLAVIAGGFLAGGLSVVFGLAKAKDRISIAGLIFGILAAIYGCLVVVAIANANSSPDTFGLIALAPLPIGIAGIALSCRRKLPPAAKQG